LTTNGHANSPASGVILNDAQRLDWLRLIRSDNVGPRTFQQLVNRFGGAAAALDALPGLLAKAGGARRIRIAEKADCERELEGLDRLGGRFIALGEPDYPPLLRMIDAAPPLVAVLGRAEVLRRPAVAIVGARNASSAGLSMAARLAGDLAGADYLIVSGLARGVDRAAHAATLASGTVAVLAGGLTRIYPAAHEQLARQICEHGCLLTEMPLQWEPRGRDFPRRNRLVSGLGYATVVVEASKRSGSLITARFANEQGREVFAVPGSPLDPRAEGPNELLRQGANICLSADNVIEALAPLRNGRQTFNLLLESGAPEGPEAQDLWDETDLFGAPPPPRSMDGLQLDEPAPPPLADLPAQEAIEETRAPAVCGDPARIVEELLALAPVSVDALVRSSGLSVADVKMALLDLEFDGKIERHGGDLVSRRM